MATTTLSGWSDIMRTKVGPGAWLKIQAFALIYLAVPTLIALEVNRRFGMDYNWFLLIIIEIVDILLITRIEPWLAVLGISTAYSQLGGESGFSKKDFWNEVTPALSSVYALISNTFLWRAFSIFGLSVVQVRGNTLLAYPIIACILVVMMISHRFTTKVDLEKSRKQVYTVFSSTLVLTVAYAAILGWFPELRPYTTAARTADQVKSDVDAQVEASFQEEAARIGTIITAMKSGTLEERIARLSPADRATYERATRGWTREQAAAITERGWPALRDTIQEITPQGMKDWLNRPSAPPAKEKAEDKQVATASETASPPTQTVREAAIVSTAKVIWQGVYTPNQMGIVSLGRLNGRYRVSCSGERTQAFFYQGGGQHGFLMDCQGGFPHKEEFGGTTIQPSPPRTDIYPRDPRPDQSRPYGELIAILSGQAVPVAHGECHSVNGEVQIGLNIRNVDYASGSGSFQIRVETC